MSTIIKHLGTANFDETCVRLLNLTILQFDSKCEFFVRVHLITKLVSININTILSVSNIMT